ncbi:MAG: hypothetical protein IT441_08225 [Phycisphaeraceae bacterium]|nr:hypothetical protein [Phycisphaeraceae bacterium]
MTPGSPPVPPEVIPVAPSPSPSTLDRGDTADPPLARLLVITLIQTLASVMVFRGTYFYTEQMLAFSKHLNLWLAAVGMGGFYIVGAVTSRHAAKRLGSRGLLVTTVACQGLIFLSQALWPGTATLTIGYMLLSTMLGWMWPVVETYVSAGRNARQTARALGVFNITWASGVPVAVAVVGPLLKLYPPLVFYLPAAMSLVNIGLILPLRMTQHLADDHPDRPAAHELDKMHAYVISTRVTMLAGYAMTSVLAAMMPSLFRDGLGLGVMAATALASWLDVPRVLMFILVSRHAFWEGRRGVLGAAAVMLPVGFLLVMLSPNVPLVLLGQAIFGLSHGMAYHAALYYATVVKNASIDAGSWHETMIGGGFALGPLCTLAGLSLGAMWSAPLVGMLVGAAPLVAVPLLGGVGPLVRPTRRSALVR